MHDKTQRNQFLPLSNPFKKGPYIDFSYLCPFIKGVREKKS